MPKNIEKPITNPEFRPFRPVDFQFQEVEISPTNKIWVAKVPKTTPLSIEKLQQYLETHHRTMLEEVIDWIYVSNDAPFVKQPDVYVFNGLLVSRKHQNNNAKH